MRLQHQTDVPASPEEVWAFLQDTAAVVQCLPGAELVEDLGNDRYQGLLRVAVGPLRMSYAGQVTVVEREQLDRRIVLDATGRDKRGSGSVRAHVGLQVEPTETGSRIDVVSDLELSGRIASLGRGVRDISNSMFTAFSRQLGEQVVGPHSVPAGPAHDTQKDLAGERPAASRPDQQGNDAEIRLMPLVWTVTRERFANFLERMSARVRPQ